MDPNTMFLAAAIRASMQLAAEQDSSVPMAKRMDFKTAFRTAYKDLQLAVDFKARGTKRDISAVRRHPQIVSSGSVEGIGPCAYRGGRSSASPSETSQVELA